MLDVKKLITGFLILATGASASALILSGTNTPHSSATAGEQVALAAAQQAPLSGNAFVEGEINTNPADVAAQTLSSTTAAQLSDPQNLTTNLADAFLNNFAAANPDGNETITAPDNQAIIAELAKSPGASNLKVPNWDVEAAENAARLVVSPSSDPNDTKEYAEGLKNIFNQYFIEPDLSGMFDKQTANSATAQIMEEKIQGALQASMNLPTPTAIAGFQKSLIKMLVYEKNTVALAQLASEDPVKAGLLLQAQDEKYKTALEELQGEVKKMSALGINFGKTSEGNGLALVNELLGIKTAHAFLGLGDIVFDPSVFAQMLVDYVKDIVLQILKNTVMTLLQQKILSWINGSGAPRFVKNWGATIVNSYANAAMSTLNAQFSCVPQAMLPNLKILLLAPSISGSTNACANQFQSQLGNNLTNFYDHFSNGGFNSYFSLFQPGGNAFGAILTIQDNVMAAAATNKEATLAKVTSAQGYKGSEVCADGSNPNGAFCVTPSGSQYNATKGSAGYSCKSTNDMLIANDGLCTHPDANGSFEPTVTTPGNVTNQAFGVALDAPAKNIAAATTIVGLLNSFLSSLLNTLAQSAINYSTAAINGTLNGQSDGGVVSTVLTPPTSATSVVEPPVSCAPPDQIAVIDPLNSQVSVQVYAQNGATDANGNPPTYTWSAPGALTSSGGTQPGSPLVVTYTAAPQNYTVTVTASTDGSTATCRITVQ